MPCGVTEMIGLGIAAASATAKMVTSALKDDNPSPAPFKLNGDQTSVAQNLASSFGAGAKPGQPGYQPVGQGLNNLGQSSLGGQGGFRERLNNLAMRLNQNAAQPVLPAQTNQLPTTPRTV